MVEGQNDLLREEIELALWFHSWPFGKPPVEWSEAQRRMVIAYLNSKSEREDAKKATVAGGISWSGGFGTVHPSRRK